MIRPVLTELALFLAPFALYALFLWVTKRGGVLDRTNWPLARLLYLVVASFLTGDRRLLPAGAMGRRAAGLDLYSGAYRRRQVRAGPDQVVKSGAAA